MKTIRTLLLTTRVDKHGDLCTREALEGAARQMSERYLPMLFNHDPRHPPVGRSIGAEVCQLEDGEWGLYAVSELFEPGDEPPLSDRPMAFKEIAPDTTMVISDRSYSSPADQNTLSEIGTLGVVVERQEKKALEPLSVLAIGIGAAASLFTAGFLNKMGSDTWDVLKSRVHALLARKREEKREHLLTFEIQLHRPHGLLVVRAILDSPTPAELALFWEKAMPQLEQEARILLDAAPPEVALFVYHFVQNRLEPVYAVRSDCVPIGFRTPVA